MIFQHTKQQVLDGSKTMTRRLINPADRFTKALAVVAIGKDVGRVIQTIPTPKNALSNGSCVHAVWSGKRVKWEVGKTYAVQPGRTQKAIARIRITAIRCEDVRNISEEDVKAEGFEDFKYFWFTWCKMHDPGLTVPNIVHGRRDYLMTRPAERYQAWALTFELVTQEAIS